MDALSAGLICNTKLRLQGEDYLTPTISPPGYNNIEGLGQHAVIRSCLVKVLSPKLFLAAYFAQLTLRGNDLRQNADACRFQTLAGGVYYAILILYIVAVVSGYLLVFLYRCHNLVDDVSSPDLYHHDLASNSNRRYEQLIRLYQTKNDLLQALLSSVADN